MASPVLTKDPGQEVRARSASTNNILVLQVRAFLEASEDVDIDIETVEDLMQTIPPDYDQDSNYEVLDTASSLGDVSNSDENAEFNEEELDISALYSIEDEGNEPRCCLRCYRPPFHSAFEAQQTWTKQEINHMMHHLKERG
jgi:hypothetical protein